MENQSVWLSSRSKGRDIRQINLYRRCRLHTDNKIRKQQRMKKCFTNFHTQVDNTRTFPNLLKIVCCFGYKTQT